MIVKLGFTGTRDAAKVQGVQLIRMAYQIHAWRERIKTVCGQDLERLERIEWHYGMCVGADAYAADLAKAAGFYLVGHPPKNRKLVSIEVRPDEIRPALDYLDRNWAIVKEVGLIYAMPKEDDEPEMKRGGGTWATIRYARQNGNPLCLMYPSGILVYEPPSKKWRMSVGASAGPRGVGFEDQS